jgi:hypothetical protein
MTDEASKHRLPEPTRATFIGALELLRAHNTDHMGRCVSCRVISPCVPRENAMRIFKTYLWLPVREPGATRPERVNATRIA